MLNPIELQLFDINAWTRSMQSIYNKTFSHLVCILQFSMLCKRYIISVGIIVLCPEHAYNVWNTPSVGSLLGYGTKQLSSQSSHGKDVTLRIVVLFFLNRKAKQRRKWMRNRKGPAFPSGFPSGGPVASIQYHVSLMESSTTCSYWRHGLFLWIQIQWLVLKEIYWSIVYSYEAIFDVI